MKTAPFVYVKLKYFPFLGIQPVAFVFPVIKRMSVSLQEAQRRTCGGDHLCQLVSEEN